MKIVKVEVFQVDCPLKGEDGYDGYKMSDGRFYNMLDSTVVRITTDTGLEGWGETLAWGTDYTKAHPEAVRAGLKVLAPRMLGLNPLHHKVINHTMDKIMVENYFAKSPIDMACWDIKGKWAGVPVYELLGGKLSPKPPAYAHISRDTGENMRKQMDVHRQRGITHFHCKAAHTVEGMIQYVDYIKDLLSPGECFTIDFNKCLSFEEALRVGRAIGNADFIMEQPCATTQECKKIMELTGVPVVYDETIDHMWDLIKTIGDGNSTGVSIKPGRAGGITKSMQWIDICEQLNIPVHIQDFGSTNIGEAAIHHMAAATSARIVVTTSDPSTMLDIVTADGVPGKQDGFIHLSDAPGLGLEVRMDVVGEPIMVFE